ncbi:MAG: polyhydroxyalkanoate depolymerase [Alphaproteobacteria bacterium]|nr:polyhydroxyalkanoate depolymerase [Alphaproteobacteria bacterium]
MYQSQSDMLLPMRTMAHAMQASFGWTHRAPRLPMMRRMSAALELFDRFTLTHERPDFGIRQVRSGGRVVDVFEKAITATAFGTLLHFRKDLDTRHPAVLVVAPLSGHFSTLLRNTVQTLLQDHDVYITDWHNARDVPRSAGEFGFADYIDTVISFLEYIGPGAHVVAVCQPCVQVLAAVALMAADDHPCQPLSMTLMGGPIDVRLSPTTVNALAFDNPIEWFEKNLITTVPSRYRGAGRRVYPGFVQLNAFMKMNMERHVKAHRKLYKHLANNETEAAAAIKEFYDEYFAVLDMPAEFYIETVRMVFQEALLAKGALTHRGARVDPSKIKRTALLTVEGERDDVCALGQTAAAHDLCTGLRPYMKRHHMQTGVGHYGLFSGKRWETQIYPIVRNTILTMAS